VSLSGVCPRSTRSPKDPYLPLADPRVARLCHGRRREQRTKRRASQQQTQGAHGHSETSQYGIPTPTLARPRDAVSTF
jgi:hypothetical protein